MFFKNSLVLLFLFFGFSVNAFAGLCKVTYANDNYFYAGVQVGDTVNFSAVKLSGHTVAGPCELKRKRSTVLMGSPVPSCPSGTSLVDGKCESLCKQMEGQSLGTVTFPEGTRDVASLCRNSCKAKSDLFFPAGNPPYGVFTYTGDSCDGSESSGGETG
ncbi:hypothetical protein, partial [Vibrio splendidus]|uniref:hypothetical protein n=1 Tax=Vibrio splendidus TaxID=29497 RepID=UPI0010558902